MDYSGTLFTKLGGTVISFYIGVLQNLAGPFGTAIKVKGLRIILGRPLSPNGGRGPSFFNSLLNGGLDFWTIHLVLWVNPFPFGFLPFWGPKKGVPKALARSPFPLARLFNCGWIIPSLFSWMGILGVSTRVGSSLGGKAPLAHLFPFPLRKAFGLPWRAFLTAFWGTHPRREPGVNGCLLLPPNVSTREEARFFPGWAPFFFLVAGF